MAVEAGGDAANGALEGAAAGVAAAIMPVGEAAGAAGLGGAA